MAPEPALAPWVPDEPEALLDLPACLAEDFIACFDLDFVDCVLDCASVAFVPVCISLAAVGLPVGALAVPD